MNYMPAIGSRVRVTRSQFPDEPCTGAVIRQYFGLARGELDHAAVRVDQPLPSWWAYPGTAVFAPEIGELTPITE